MAGLNGPKIVTNGLVLALDAADKKSYSGSGTAWNDLSGNNNNGTLTNGPTFSSANGGSIVFDGTNDYVSTSITQTYQKFTLECWFYNTSSSKTFRCLFSKNSFYATATDDWPVSINLDSGGTTLTFDITSGTSYFITTSSTGTHLTATLPSLNTWYYVTATYDQVNVNLYLNGILQSTAANTISLPNNTARTWTIGRAAYEFGGGVDLSQYNGNIAIAKIYNRGLSSTEVLQNFNATRGRFGI